MFAAKFAMKKPCKDCPFLKNSPMHLRPERLPSIVEGLHNNKDFSCHKSVDYSSGIENETGNTTYNLQSSKYCAGAMIYLEKQNKPTLMMKIGEVYGHYNYKEMLEHKDMVIDSLEERSICDWVHKCKRWWYVIW